MFFCVNLFFFFFQAEDGIRDRTVTGVQTCALPISLACVEIPEQPGVREWQQHEVRRDGDSDGDFKKSRTGSRNQIGRASCREKCRSRGAADHEKKKE